MWQKNFCGFLGIWVIALAFLAFSESLHRLLLVLTGLIITATAFWGHRFFKPVAQISREVLSTPSASPENKKMETVAGGINKTTEENKKQE